MEEAFASIDLLLSLPPNLVAALSSDDSPEQVVVQDEPQEKSKRRASVDEIEEKESKRVKLRKNEQKYRRTLHELFTELGTLTNTESKSRKSILAEAIQQLSTSKTRSVGTLACKDGIDYRNLFLTDRYKS